MSSVIWSIIAVLAMVFTMEDFFSSFFKKRENHKWNVVAWCGFFLFHYIVMKRIQTSTGNLIGNLFSLSVVCWIAYREKFLIRSAMIMLGMSLGVISEGVIAVVLFIVKGNTEGNIRLYGLTAKIIFWLCVRILCLMKKERIEQVQRKRYVWLLTIATGSNMLCMMVIYNIALRSTDEVIRSSLLIFTFLILVSDIVFFKLYTMYQEKKKIEVQRQEYAYQLEAYDRQVDEKRGKEREFRKMKHDMKNNMIYLQELLNSDPEKAKEYLEEYIGETFSGKNEFAKSGNLAIDAVLNYKYVNAVEKRIRMELELKIPDVLPYKSSDLCIVLGNLLDNAMEATEKLENEKDIFVRLLYQKEKLLIKIQNPYTGDLKKDRTGNYISEKKDRENHGIGLKSVRKVVEKYEGVMEIHTEDQIFEICVII